MCGITLSKPLSLKIGKMESCPGNEVTVKACECTVAEKTEICESGQACMESSDGKQFKCVAQACQVGKPPDQECYCLIGGLQKAKIAAYVGNTQICMEIDAGTKENAIFSLCSAEKVDDCICLIPDEHGGPKECDGGLQCINTTESSVCTPICDHEVEITEDCICAASTCAVGRVCHEDDICGFKCEAHCARCTKAANLCEVCDKGYMLQKDQCTERKVTTGLIVGVVAGCIVVIIVVALILYFVVWKRSPMALKKHDFYGTREVDAAL